MNLDATLNAEAGPYAGLDRFVARKKLVTELEEKGLLAGVEDRVIPIPTCYRSGDVVEPALLSQWYVKMAPLADLALDCGRWDEKKGFDPERHVRFVPGRYLKTYEQWLEPRRDWCISRQLWWGHQIPVWYVVSETGSQVTDHTPYVVARGEEDAWKEAREKFGPGCALQREEDVLDTWFSSGLWPFSTLGWPDETPELQSHYPTDVLVTDRGIIYFWVARMIFSGLRFLGKPPFHTVYINGTVLDEKGQRMSKSKGNGVDPVEMIDKFGADAVRFALLTLTTEGQDIKLSPVKFEGARNFANKLWNAVRFVHPHLGAAQASWEGPALELADKWILKVCANRVGPVTRCLEELRFSEAAAALYDLTWNDFCSRYLEIRKKDITGPEGPAKTAAVTVFSSVLQDIIGMLHPFMPFLTEEIHSHLARPEFLITGAWPKPYAPEFSAADMEIMEHLLGLVDAVRQIRGNYSLPPQQSLKVTAHFDQADAAQALIPHASIALGLERFAALNLGASFPKPSFSASG
jgi:valyl-tRNA synthetase